jgi:hypothetical protein
MTLRPGAKDLVTFALVLAATLAAWEIVKAPLSLRLPTETAVRIAPQSPDVLGRAAETELAAKRPGNAAVLAGDSLARAPFNARALRVFGIASAQLGSSVDVNSIITLAGNWSLRDDPAHAWLLDHRLRQGDYSSAFAHADTLVRRQTDTQALTYNLFATAALQDERALVPLAAILAKDPPWRSGFLTYLLDRPDAAPVMVKLGIVLGRMGRPLSVMELRQIYETLFSTGRLNEMVSFQRNTGSPSAPLGVRNSDFSDSSNNRILPLDWTINPSANATADLVSDDLRPDNYALRADFTGGERALLAEQVLILPAGNMRFSGEFRHDRGVTGSFRWILTCVQTGTLIATVSPQADGSDGGWSRFSQEITVPLGCLVQRLQLEALPSDSGAGSTQWFDALHIQPAL